MLSITNVSYAWGPQEVLRDASLFVGRGEKVGLAGVNGAGKSTLMHVAAGALPPDAGRVTRPRRVGHLPQEPELSGALASDMSLIDVVVSSGPTAPLAARLAQAEQALAAAAGPELSAAVDAYGRIEEDFRDAGGYAAQASAATVLSGLGLPASLADRPVRTLSAGQRTRLEMARVLASGADLLLLDEPTNHLDVDATRWLMDFLARTDAAVLIVSHDLRLLDHAISRVYELDGRSRRLTEFKGTYSEYLAWSEARRATLETTHGRQQREIKRFEASTDRLRAHAFKSDKLARRVKVMDRRLDRMREQVVELPLKPGEIGMRVGQAPRSGRLVLQVRDVAHAYGTEPVLHNVSFSLERGQRLAVIGRNGAGKSTLLNIVAGKLNARQGTVSHGHNVEFAHFTHALEPTLAARSAFDVVRSLTSPNESRHPLLPRHPVVSRKTTFFGHCAPSRPASGRAWPSPGSCSSGATFSYSTNPAATSIKPPRPGSSKRCAATQPRWWSSRTTLGSWPASSPTWSCSCPRNASKRSRSGICVAWTSSRGALLRRRPSAPT